MPQFATILIFWTLSFTALGQNTADTVPVFTKQFKSVEEVLSSSEIIDGKTFELEFLIRALIDNAWFLRLKKDSSYEYVHWSGWGDADV